MTAAAYTSHLFCLFYVRVLDEHTLCIYQYKLYHFTISTIVSIIVLNNMHGLVAYTHLLKNWDLNIKKSK